MKKLLSIILISLFIVSCMNKKQIYKQNLVNKIEVYPLPSWIYHTPNDCIVGISHKSIDKEQMINSAKQMAAVIKSRNNSSFTVEKTASTTKEEILRSGKSDFKLNVSASPEETKQIYENLQLINFTMVHGYYIGLFSEINNKEITSKFYVDKKPEFFEQNKLEVTDKYIVYYATFSSASLIKAWEEANEKARLEIAKYLQKQVQSAIINKNESIDKRISIETKMKLEKIELVESYVTSQLKDNLRTYQVYHKIRVKRF